MKLRTIEDFQTIDYFPHWNFTDDYFQHFLNLFIFILIFLTQFDLEVSERSVFPLRQLFLNFISTYFT